MKNKEMKVKAMSMAVAMSMVVGLCPSTIFAATGSQTAKDGTYTKTAHVARTAEDDENEDEWNEYDVEVSLKVEDGKFSAITVTPGEGYNAESDSYFAKAVSCRQQWTLAIAPSEKRRWRTGIISGRRQAVWHYQYRRCSRIF